MSKTRHAAIVMLAWSCGGAPQNTATPQDLPQPQTNSSAKTYAIHMARALHVGERIRLVSDAEEFRTTTMSRQGSSVEKKRTLSRMHMDAIITVLALDEKQDALRARYDVSDLSASGDKMESLLHDQHVEITRAKKEDDAIVLVDGAPATSDVRDALRMVLTFRTGGPSDDEVFGSKMPRAVGEKWPIDARRAHDDLVADQGEAMENAVLNGEVSFAGITPSNGVDCIDLRSKLDMNNITVPNAPAGSQVIAGHATATFQGLFPIDDKLPRALDKLDFVMTMKLKVATPSGDVMVVVDVANKRDRHWTML